MIRDNQASYRVSISRETELDISTFGIETAGPTRHKVSLIDIYRSRRTAV